MTDPRVWRWARAVFYGYAAPVAEDALKMVAAIRTALAAGGATVSPTDFELIAESIPDLVFTADAEGATDYFNRRGTDYTGLPYEANLGWGWLSLLHPDDIGRAEAAWSAAVEGTEPFEAEYRIRRADGEYRWHVGRALPIHGPQGQVVKWIGTCTDIEESKRQEARLREAERQAAEAVGVLEAMEQSSPVGYALITPDFRVARMNGTLAAISGNRAEESLGRRVADVVPELWPQLEPIYRRVLETGETVTGYEIAGGSAAADGSVCYWLSSFHPVTVEGELIGIGVVAIDITERKQSESFRAAVMDQMLEGVCATDPKGRFTFVNAAASKMLGWPAEELSGRSMHEVNSQRADGAPVAPEECPLTRVRQQGATLRVADAAFTRKDGTIFPVAYSAAPLAHGIEGEPNGVVIVFRDTTEEKAEQTRVQRELAALSWLGRIRDALDEGRLRLDSQPIVPLRGGEPASELLLRMVGRDGETILPGAFLPIAEKYGLIGEIDRWVVTEAARIAAHGRRVHANLSAESLGNLDVLRLIEQALEQSGADPANLTFEITETALMSDLEAAELFARGLVALGCKLALDDFGTGYGSFTYLKRLPLDYIKIDREFVHDLRTNEPNQHLVKAVVGLAEGFHQQTIAEGVEDQATLDLLADWGVDYVQGFHVGPPLPQLRVTD